MASLSPHWMQPSHPDVQSVIVNEAAFASKSTSKVHLPPFAVYAKMNFPPCTVAGGASYATVQVGKAKHIDLNSDLLFINHSCEPSLIFDTTNYNILAGPEGIRPGEELTFFYPSTEWDMAQPFDCLCGKPTCRGKISGAKHMSCAQLQGVWLNAHIRDLLAERDGDTPPYNTYLALNGSGSVKAEKRGHGPPENGDPCDAMAEALRYALSQAENVVSATRLALQTHMLSTYGTRVTTPLNGSGNGHSEAERGVLALPNGHMVATNGSGHGGVGERLGRTSRELGGEMGGDTITV